MNDEARAARFAAYVGEGRRGPRGAWRVFAVIGLVLLAQLLALILLTALAAQATGAPLSRGDRTSQLLVALACLATAPAALALGLRALHGRPLSSLYGPERRLLSRELLLGAGAAVGLTIAGLGAATALGLATLSWSDAAPAPRLALLAAFLLIPLQAAGEELVFRGYLLQEIACRAPVAIAWAAAPSALFALLHFSPETPADEALGYAASSFLFGLLAAALVWRSGGLSAAIGLHVANNWIALLLFEPAQGIAGLGPIAVRLAPDGAYAALALDAALLLGVYVALAPRLGGRARR